MAPTEFQYRGFHCYPAADGWRWQLLDDNNRLIAEGGEAYVESYGVRQAIDNVIGEVAQRGFEEGGLEVHEKGEDAGQSEEESQEAPAEEGSPEGAGR